MKSVNISVIIPKIIWSKSHDMDQHTGECFQGLLDSWIYTEADIVSSVPTSCISIKHYRTFVNMKIELLEKNL